MDTTLSAESLLNSSTGVKESTMSVYDRGELILLETTFRKKILGVNSYAYTDPSSPAITVYDVASTAVITAPLSRSNVNSAGFYNYTLATSTGWARGLYAVKITAVDNALTDVTLTEHVFELK